MPSGEEEEIAAPGRLPAFFNGERRGLSWLSSPNYNLIPGATGTTTTGLSSSIWRNSVAVLQELKNSATQA
jgi:hypothetical protein